MTTQAYTVSILPMDVKLFKELSRKFGWTVCPAVGEEVAVPEWQVQEVRRRDAAMKNDPTGMLDCDVVMSELEGELERKLAVA